MLFTYSQCNDVRLGADAFIPCQPVDSVLQVVLHIKMENDDEDDDFGLHTSRPNVDYEDDVGLHASGQGPDDEDAVGRDEHIILYSRETNFNSGKYAVAANFLSMVVRNVTVSDEGVYRCSTKCGKRTVSADTSLTVYGKHT